MPVGGWLTGVAAGGLDDGGLARRDEVVLFGALDHALRDAVLH